MRDRIHARGSGQCSGQRHGQVGIADRRLGHQMRRQHAQLAAVVQDQDGTSTTSPPVPAVVGIAMTGATFAVMRATPPSIAAYCCSDPSCVAIRATPLARSMDEPPPNAMIPSQSARRYAATPFKTAASFGLGGVSSKT